VRPTLNSDYIPGVPRRIKGKSKERTLEAKVNALRGYRRKDLQFRHAFAAFVEGEASQKDPLEGHICPLSSCPQGVK
jgi:hypothetical protein